MLETLDATAVRHWCADGLAALRRHQQEIDALNVYPVPDGDTGTNLVLTFTSAQHAIALDLDNSSESTDGEQTSHGRVLRLMARGALLGARGNSGVIVSQILRGLADALADTAVVRGRALARALGAATATAYAAVATPVEGTVLTVVAAAARAADRTGSDDLVTVVRAAATAAAQALAATPGQLPPLAAAGVVDAGGRGLCVLLEALLAVVRGQEPDGGDDASGVRAGPAPLAPATDPPTSALSPDRDITAGEYAYEVQYLLDATADAVRRLRTELARLGGSLVIVGGGSAESTATWHVHVHVNDIGAALEAGVVAGRPYQISVTRFADQPEPPRVRRAAVVVAAGDGLAALFTGEGATVVGGTPSTGELLDAMRATGARQIVILPNGPDTQVVASAAAREAESLGVAASVVPTRSPVQALSALAVRDPGRRFEDDVIAMAEAAGACRYAEVCYAVREALTMAGRCRPGDVLALVEGEVLLIGTDLTGTCRTLLDQLLGGGGELVTLVLGEHAPVGLGEAVRAHAARCWPFVEVHSYVGGQPHFPLLVGVE